MSFTVQDNGLISVGPTALTPDQALEFAVQLANAAYAAKWPRETGPKRELHLVSRIAVDAMKALYSEVYCFRGPVR